MKDYNVCEHCSTYQSLDARDCSGCNQPLIRDARRAISVWRLGDIEDGRLGPLMARLREEFNAPVVLQPSFIDERPSARTDWKGLSASTFLAQVERRHSRGTFLSLGITEENITAGRDWNFLFGLGRMDGRTAVMSIHPLDDGCDDDVLADRIFKIAQHELGHALNLDHHPYGAGVDCTMVGDTEVDSVDTLDASDAGFCADCSSEVKKHLGRRATERR